MGERAQVEQSQIELTPSDVGQAASPFARPREGERAPAHRRRFDRHGMVLLIVGVLGLAIGWVFGRAASEVAPVESVVATTATGASDPAEPTVSAETDRSAAATDAAPTVATTASAVGGTARARTTIDAVVASPLQGQPMEIVAFGGNLLMRLDVASGRLVTQAVDRQPFGRPRLLVNEDRVVIPSLDAIVASPVIADDGSVEAVELPPSALIIGVDARRDGGLGGDLWVMSRDVFDGYGGTVERISLTGDPTGDAIEVPAKPSQVDPAGGFIVEVADGAFRVTSTETVPITAGELLAVGADTALVHECDAALVCGHHVVDRSTGDRRVVAVPRSPGPERLRRFASVRTESISPDGSSAAVEVLDPLDRSASRPTLGLIDLSTGEVVEIGPVQDIHQVAFSPDGRFVLFNDAGRLATYDRSDGSMFMVADELSAIDEFAVRVVESARSG